MTVKGHITFVVEASIADAFELTEGEAKALLEMAMRDGAVALEDYSISVDSIDLLAQGAPKDD